MKSLRLPILASTISLMTLGLNNTALADKYNRHENNSIEYAKVVNVQPLYETIRYNEPYQECRYETRSYSNHDSKTAVIVGSLIGGAIGNRLGHSQSNKKVGAVAGAILGGSIANDINRNHNSHRTREERICTTVDQISYKEVISGYNVAYKYHGRIFHTTMNDYPGDRIPVAVDVRPVGFR